MPSDIFECVAAKFNQRLVYIQRYIGSYLVKIKK